MMLDPQGIAAVLAAALAVGVGLSARARSAPAYVRLAWALLPVVILATTLVAWAAFRLVPFWTWSAARLAASARLAYGFPLFTAPDSALVNGWVYGPVSAFAYLPAIWAGEPLAALRAATWLNAFYFLLPLTLVVTLAWRRGAHPVHLALTLLFGVAALLAPFGTWYGAAALNADTVAVCLGTLSCLALLRGKSLPLAAALYALAAWTKQIEAPLALAQIGFLAWTRGFRAAWSYTGWAALAGGVSLAGFGGWFGFAELLHCTMVIPSRHPIEFARLGGLLGAFLAATWWAWLLALLTRPWRAPAAGASPAGAFASAQLFLLASLILLPGGLAAAAKIGGDQNSLHSITYVVLAGLAGGTGFLTSDRPGTVAVAGYTLLAGLALVLGVNLHRIVAHDHLAVRDPGAAQREAFAFARARPGKTYYPCNPLITLMADRRDYPFDYGVFDWRLASAAPPPAALRQLLPADLTFVIYHEKDPSREMLRAFPEFTRVAPSGPWDLYLRSPNPP